MVDASENVGNVIQFRQFKEFHLSLTSYILTLNTHTHTHTLFLNTNTHTLKLGLCIITNTSSRKKTGEESYSRCCRKYKTCNRAQEKRLVVRAAAE